VNAGNLKMVVALKCASGFSYHYCDKGNGSHALDIVPNDQLHHTTNLQ